MRNPFRRTARRTVNARYESRDLRDDQLDRFSGGIPHFSYPESRVNAMIRPELPILTARPSDNTDLWF